jgi:hypothetical protein
MKCIPFYCCIVHELKGTEIKTKLHMSSLYNNQVLTFKFCALLCVMFNCGVARVVHVLTLNESCMNCIHLSFSDRSSPGSFYS